MPSPSVLFFSLFFSLVGVSLSMYGKRAANIPHILIGIALTFYSYFISSLWLICLAGIVLCVLAYLLRE